MAQGYTTYTNTEILYCMVGNTTCIIKITKYVDRIALTLIAMIRVMLHNNHKIPKNYMKCSQNG